MNRFVLKQLFTAMILAATISAGVPLEWSYQGHLADDVGNPINGVVNVTFRIYDSPTGGTMLWSETHNSLMVSDGLFTVTLGSINPIQDSVTAPIMGRDTTLLWRYLAIQIGADPEMTPRTVLASVPYSHRVSTVDGATGGIISGDVAIQWDLGDLQYGDWNIELNAEEMASSLTLGNIGDTNSVSITADSSGPEMTMIDYESAMVFDSSLWRADGIIMYHTEDGGTSRDTTLLARTGLEFVDIDDVVYRYGPDGMFSIWPGIRADDTVAYFGQDGLKIASGAMDGYVMTSDANGVGTWQFPGTGSSCWQCPEDYTYLTDIDDSVGIGTETPLAKLHVEGDAGGAAIRGVSDGSGISAATSAISAINNNSGSGGVGLWAESNNRFAIYAYNNDDDATVFARNYGSGPVLNLAADGTGSGTVTSAVSGDFITCLKWPENEVRFEIDNDGNLFTAGKATIGPNHTNSGTYAFVAGENNIASGSFSTVSGGMDHTADGNFSAISGGVGNTAYGHYSAIPGGRDNDIQLNAHVSMAFGREVCVIDSFRVVFFDSVYSGRLGINRDCVSGINHPIHVGTIATNGNGAHLTAGGTWTNSSSRTFKEGFESIDGQELLEKVSNMSLKSWNYKNSDERHIGPVAEDFVGAFDVGTIREDGTRDDKYLSNGDVAGVALAGVQELYKRNQELEEEIAELRTLVKELLGEKSK